MTVRHSAEWRRAQAVLRSAEDLVEKIRLLTDSLDEWERQPLPDMWDNVVVARSMMERSLLKIQAHIAGERVKRERRAPIPRSLRDAALGGGPPPPPVDSPRLFDPDELGQL